MLLPTYDLSLQNTTNTVARHWTVGKKRDRDAIVVYLPKILYEPPDRWDSTFDDIVFELIAMFLLERICLEARINNRIRVQQGLGKKLIRGRCKLYERDGARYSCKMEYANAFVLGGLV